ncbi:MAG: hypothetical protein IPH04_05395 [Saprospirales bacterium]|nr:hypothetical protein [Saprospirales bacterium]
MNTTNYTIELLIAGISTTLWLLLLSMAIWGNWLMAWLPAVGNELVTVLILFPFVYMIGVLGDRLSSGLVSPLEDRIRKRYFPSEDEYKRARSITYVRHEPLIKLFEYNSVRVRICRNWCFNGVLILISWMILMFSSHSPVPYGSRVSVFFFSVIFLSATIGAAFFGLRKLLKKDMEYLKIQSEM